VGRTAGPVDKTIPPKILLCAPSNAAIDEVAHRLRDGVLGSGKRGICPQVVRVGADNSINIGVKDISLDFLVDQKMNTSSSTDNTPNQTTSEIAVIRKELDSVKKQRQEKQEELAQIQNNTARTLTLQDEIKKLNHRRMALTQQFDRLKDKQKSDFRTLDASRRKCRMEILQEADVICGTLSGSGHEALQLEQFDFEMVIIDEAAQAIELSSLIPLKYKCRRCIMVGGTDSQINNLVHVLMCP
jgi:senataxin